MTVEEFARDVVSAHFDAVDHCHPPAGPETSIPTILSFQDNMTTFRTAHVAEIHQGGGGREVILVRNTFEEYNKDAVILVKREAGYWGGGIATYPVPRGLDADAAYMAVLHGMARATQHVGLGDYPWPVTVAKGLDVVFNQRDMYADHLVADTQAAITAQAEAAKMLEA